MLIGVGPIFVKKMVVFDFRERKNRELYKQFLFFRQKIKTKEDVPNQYTISGDHIFSRANNFRFLNANLDQTARSMFQISVLSQVTTSLAGFTKET